MQIPSNKLLLRNARVIGLDRVLDSTDVLIESGEISNIAKNQRISSVEVSEIDLSGHTLFPGFIDAHIHGAAGIDTMDATAEDLGRVSEFLARQGVTAWLPTLVPSTREQYQQAIHAISQCMKQPSTTDAAASEYRLQSGSSHGTNGPTEVGTLNAVGARVLGVHYEGPFVSTEQCGALHREHFLALKSAADLDTLPTITNAPLNDGKHAEGVRTQAVHMMTLAPEVAGGIDLVGKLKKRGWIVSIGHTRATREVLDQARSAGAHHMTHFMNAMTPLHHREAGAVGWGLIHDDVTFDIIADGIHIDPQILRLIITTKRTENVSLISDAIAAAGMRDGDYDIWGEKINVTNGRTRNDRGSIAGSVITMHDAVRMMLSLSFSEPQVARMASLNPARLLGLDKDRGSIEEGKRADLVALDKNQNVQMTIIGGEVCRF